MPTEHRTKFEFSRCKSGRKICDDDITILVEHIFQKCALKSEVKPILFQMVQNQEPPLLLLFVCVRSYDKVLMFLSFQRLSHYNNAGHIHVIVGRHDDIFNFGQSGLQSRRGRYWHRCKSWFLVGFHLLSGRHCKVRCVATIFRRVVLLHVDSESSLSLLRLLIVYCIFVARS
jgi:hypothetical protein